MGYSDGKDKKVEKGYDHGAAGFVYLSTVKVTKCWGNTTHATNKEYSDLAIICMFFGPVVYLSMFSHVRSHVSTHVRPYFQTCMVVCLTKCGLESW